MSRAGARIMAERRAVERYRTRPRPRKAPELPPEPVTVRAARFALLAALGTLTGCAMLEPDQMRARACYRDARSMAEHAECRALPVRPLPAILTAEPVRSLERSATAPGSR